MFNLTDMCSQHFTYRELIHCGETFQRSDIPNLPQQPSSWQALSDLAIQLLDPVVEQFGPLKLSYGFCSPALSRARQALAKERNILPAIYPSLDQHVCHELNAKGQPVCERGGAACDFIVPGVSTLDVTLWIARHLPFDRIYYYGSSNSVHVSYNQAAQCSEITVMTPKTAGRGYIPSTMKADKFLERFGDES
ncbi:hypothetical protein [Parendozoicomonas sp. Alg238-R29]|uniref:hypothetical protein n=1 Tax=Parendozoicomonas sp. Alg238-R29 TaxID=2993446 RepID=UPI00248E5C8E|nr:hypothetical protein [Parendozoicomonas sp. Alg238-R29]